MVISIEDRHRRGPLPGPGVFLFHLGGSYWWPTEVAGEGLVAFYRMTSSNSNPGCGQLAWCTCCFWWLKEETVQFLLAQGSKGESVMAEESWQQTAIAERWQITSSITNAKRRVRAGRAWLWLSTS